MLWYVYAYTQYSYQRQAARKKKLKWFEGNTFAMCSMTKCPLGYYLKVATQRNNGGGKKRYKIRKHKPHHITHAWFPLWFFLLLFLHKKKYNTIASSTSQATIQCMPSWSMGLPHLVIIIVCDPDLNLQL